MENEISDTQEVINTISSYTDTNENEVFFRYLSFEKLSGVKDDYNARLIWNELKSILKSSRLLFGKKNNYEGFPYLGINIVIPSDHYEKLSGSETRETGHGVEKEMETILDYIMHDDNLNSIDKVDLVFTNFDLVDRWIDENSEKYNGFTPQYPEVGLFRKNISNCIFLITPIEKPKLLEGSKLMSRSRENSYIEPKKLYDLEVTSRISDKVQLVKFELDSDRRISFGGDWYNSWFIDKCSYTIKLDTNNEGDLYIDGRKRINDFIGVGKSYKLDSSGITVFCLLEKGLEKDGKICDQLKIYRSEAQAKEDENDWRFKVEFYSVVEPPKPSEMDEKRLEEQTERSEDILFNDETVPDNVEDLSPINEDEVALYSDETIPDNYTEPQEVKRWERWIRHTHRVFPFCEKGIQNREDIKHFNILFGKIGDLVEDEESANLKFEIDEETIRYSFRKKIGGIWGDKKILPPNTIMEEGYSDFNLVFGNIFNNIDQLKTQTNLRKAFIADTEPDKSIRLEERIYTIGRNKNCDIRVYNSKKFHWDNVGASEIHAIITYEEDSFKLYNISRNSKVILFKGIDPTNFVTIKPSLIEAEKSREILKNLGTRSEQLTELITDCLTYCSSQLLNLGDKIIVGSSIFEFDGEGDITDKAVIKDDKLDTLIDRIDSLGRDVNRNNNIFSRLYNNRDEVENFDNIITVQLNNRNQYQLQLDMIKIELQKINTLLSTNLSKGLTDEESFEKESGLVKAQIEEVQKIIDSQFEYSRNPETVDNPINREDSPSTEISDNKDDYKPLDHPKTEESCVDVGNCNNKEEIEEVKHPRTVNPSSFIGEFTQRFTSISKSLESENIKSKNLIVVNDKEYLNIFLSLISTQKRDNLSQLTQLKREIKDKLGNLSESLVEGSITPDEYDRDTDLLKGIQEQIEQLQMNTIDDGIEPRAISFEDVEKRLEKFEDVKCQDIDSSFEKYSKTILEQKKILELLLKKDRDNFEQLRVQTEDKVKTYLHHINDGVVQLRGKINLLLLNLIMDKLDEDSFNSEVERINSLIEKGEKLYSENILETIDIDTSETSDEIIDSETTSSNSDNSIKSNIKHQDENQNANCTNTPDCSKTPEDDINTPNSCGDHIEPLVEVDPTSADGDGKVTLNRRDDLDSVNIFLGMDNDENLSWGLGSKALSNKHMLILGKSGVGKSYFVQTLLYELSKDRVPSVIFDYSNSYTRDEISKSGLYQKLGNKLETTIVRTKRIGINPFKRHSFIIAGEEGYVEKNHEVAERVADLLNKVFKFGDQQLSALKSAIKSGLDQHGDDMEFSKLTNFLIDCESRFKKGSESVLTKIEPFINSDCFGGSVNFSWESLVNSEGKVSIIQLDGYSDDTKKIVTEFILWDAWSFMQRNGCEETPLMVVLDEAQNISLSKSSPAGKILTEGRKFGINGIFALQFAKGQFDQGDITRLGQSATRVVFKPSAEEMKQAADLIDSNYDVREMLEKLEKGSCLISGDIFKSGNRKFRELKIPSFYDRD
jgi:hypothetical protein